MTLIIGHRDGWIVADKMALLGGICAHQPAKKIYRGWGLLFALDGATDKVLGPFQRDGRLLDENISMAELSAAMYEAALSGEPECSAVVVSTGQLHWLSGYGVSEVMEHRKWICIGSGMEHATGFLMGVEHGGGEVSTVVAQECVEVVSGLEPGVGRGSDAQYVRTE